jgi:hypothetical protein
MECKNLVVLKRGLFEKKLVCGSIMLKRVVEKFSDKEV